MGQVVTHHLCACKLSWDSGQQWALRSPQCWHLRRRSMSNTGVSNGVRITLMTNQRYPNAHKIMLSPD